MNYAIVVVGGFAFIGVIYWFAWARYHFIGPKRPDHTPSEETALI